MTIGQLHKGDYIQTEAGKGYILAIFRKSKEVLVALDFLGDIPAKMSVKLVEKIIKAKSLYSVSFYYYKEDDINRYDFSTLKEAKDYLERSKEKDLADSYTLVKRDRDTNEIIEEIIY